MLTALGYFCAGVLFTIGALRLRVYIREWRTLNRTGKLCGVVRNGRLNKSYRKAQLEALGVRYGIRAEE